MLSIRPRGRYMSFYVDDTYIGPVNKTKVDLSGLCIEDISCLVSLSHLEITDLSLRQNNITNTSSISHLPHLKRLDLGCNPISDLSTLETNAYRIKLEGHSIDDFSSISKMTSIQELYLREVNLTDVTFLSSLPKLRILDVSNNPLSDISPLKGMKSLKQLWAWDTCIELNLRENLVSQLSN